MNKGFTVEELYKFCQDAIMNGHGKKHIQISSDDEGNSFHSLFYGFTTNNEDLQYYIDEYLIDNHNLKADEIVILG